MQICYLMVGTYRLCVWVFFFLGGGEQGWICRLTGARENITVCGVAPRPGLNPSGLVNNSSLAAGPPVHRDENFVI